MDGAFSGNQLSALLGLMESGERQPLPSSRARAAAAPPFSATACQLVPPIPFNSCQSFSAASGLVPTAAAPAAFCSSIEEAFGREFSAASFPPVQACLPGREFSAASFLPVQACLPGDWSFCSTHVDQGVVRQAACPMDSGSCPMESSFQEVQEAMREKTGLKLGAPLASDFALRLGEGAISSLQPGTGHSNQPSSPCKLTGKRPISELASLSPSNSQSQRLQDTVEELLQASFNTRARCKEAVELFVGLNHGKTLKQDNKKSGSRKVVLNCTGCSNAIVILKFAATRGFYVSPDSCFDHNSACFAAYTPSYNATAKLRAVNEVMRLTGGSDGGKKAGEAALSMAGVKPSRFVAFSATHKIRNKCEEEHNLSYQMLKNYLELAAKLNPGSAFAFKPEGGEGAFTHAGFVCGPLADLVLACGIPVAGLDAEHFHHGECKLRCIKLVVRVSLGEGSSKNIPLGFLICPVENEENYEVLVDCIRQVPALWKFMSADSFVVISDRMKGLANAVRKAWPRAYHQFCGRHLMVNSMADGRGKYSESLFWALRNAATEADFITAREALEKANEKACSYLMETNLEAWQLWHIVKRGIMMFGQQTSNLVEQENARDDKLGLRALCPYEYAQEQLTLMAKVSREVHQHVCKLLERGQFLTSHARANLQEEEILARTVSVLPTDRALTFFTRTMGTINRSSTREINLAHPFAAHGRCVITQQERRPCRHVLASMHALLQQHNGNPRAIGFTSSMHIMAHLHHKCYLTATAAEAALQLAVKLPDTDNVVPSRGVLPPVPYSSKEKKKRTKRARIKSRGEK